MNKPTLLNILLSVAFFFITLTSAFGQEICDNGIDDDGDGFVDCFDNQCINATNCNDDYIQGDPNCEVLPSTSPTFSVKLLAASPNNTASGTGMVAVGDVDGDGFPEIVSGNYYTDMIYVLDGRTGAIKYQRSLTVKPYYEMVIADIDGDGCAEIFVPYQESSNSTRYGIMAFNCTLTSILWSSATRHRPGNIGVADFDGDGRSEIYARDEIFDASTGLTLHSSSFSKTSSSLDFIEKRIVSGGVAVDILSTDDCGTDCSGQELVLGGFIYSVNIERTLNRATLTLQRSINYRPTYYAPWEHNRSATSVVDYNQDGFLDVIMPGKVPGGGNVTTVFFWDVHNDNVLTFADNIDNWPIGAGRPNIADIDGDGQLNITIVSGEFLYALNEDMTLKWKRQIIEHTSGTTGTTIFDFNGDGAYETVYRDEEFLYIINGNDGTSYTTFPCRSLTFVEYPIVADVNNDGGTEICVTCLTNDTDEITASSDRNAQVRVFGARNDQWVPARKVWNQHAYFNVNVNDDLTIPPHPQKHHLVFSEDVCGTGETRPLNSFLNQSPIITYQGCTNYAAADINFESNVVINPPQCPETDFTISFDLSNNGDKNVNATIPITFYDGNPETATATKLNTISHQVSIPVGSTVTVNDLMVTGPGTNFMLFIAFNHDGVTPPPITYPSGGIAECVYDNIAGPVSINPTPFSVSAVKVSDNDKCLLNVPDNGEARAYVLIDGAEVTAGYTFNWYNTSPPAGPVDFTGVSYANLAARTYAVTAINNAKSCAGEITSVTIENGTPIVPVVTINIESVFSDCNNPNGRLRAIVNGGEPPGGFDFEWYIGNSVFLPVALVSVNAEASNLSSQLYTVVARNKTTGCQTIASETIPLSTDFPVVAATVLNNLTSCDVATSNGSASANVGGSTVGFTFSWYNGNAVKPTADFTGSVYTDLPAGNYTVTATKDGTGCISDPFIVTIQDLANQPTVTAQVDSEQSSCIVGGSTGSVSAHVGGATAGFTFNWYQGQTTDPMFEVVGSPSPTITGLAAGIYTVKVTNGSECSDSEEVTIMNLSVAPIVSAAADAAQTICTVGNENGRVSANVAGATTGFTFYWFDGDQTAGIPDIENPDETGITYTGRSAGDYTVVAVNTTTNCASSPVKATVIDETVATTPTITTTLTDQTSCDNTSPNGAITASVTLGGVDADFTFRVFEGQNTTPANEVAGSPAARVTGLSSGLYTVLATHNTTGCFNSTEVTIDNDEVLPTISATATPISSCDPDNGSITASVDIDDVADYTFMWYNGTSIKPVSDYPTETSNMLSDLSAGTYTVGAIHNSRRCNTQNAVTVTVMTDPATEIDIVEDATRTVIPANCTGGNGQLGVTASSPGNTSGFTFDWYSGDINSGLTDLGNDGTTSGIPPTKNTIQNIVSGRYTVIVRDIDTGCQDSLVMDLGYNDQHTILDVVPTNNTNCTVFNGAATIQVDPSPATIGLMGGTTRQDWYRIDVYQDGVRVQTAPGAAPPATSTTITGLAPGDYTVIAVETNPALNNCTTAIDFMIEDMSVDPVITLNTSIDNTNCTAAPNGNGSISLTIDGVMTPAAGYTYSWYEGRFAMGTVLPAAQTLLGHTAINLTGGFYTVEVTNTTSNCPTVATFNIMDSPPIISISTIATTPDTNCNVDDGTATVTALLPFADPDDYTYEWLERDVTMPISGAGTAAMIDAGVSLDGGSPGGTGVDYFVRATHNMNACTSSLVKFTITNTATDPVINATITDNTECGGTFNGDITIELDGGTPDAGYMINWVDVVSGDDLGVAAPGVFITPNGLIASRVPPGNYRVEVTDNTPANEGCMASATFTVLDNPAILSITDPDDLVLVSNDKCTAPYTGSATINFVKENGVQMPTGGYTFQWFDASMSMVDGSGDGPTLSGLNSGIYFVTATNTTTDCNSLISFEIEDITTPPVVNLVKFINPTKCNGPDSGGFLSVDADGSTNTTNYTFAWYTGGVPVAGAPFEPNNPEVSNQTTQSYTVGVTNVLSGCVTYETYTLTDVVAPVILSTSSSPVTNCDTDNGVAFAKVINTDSDYNYMWYTGNQTTPDLSNPEYTGQNWMGRSAGEYTVVAIDVHDADCVSDPFIITIQNLANQLTIATTLTNQTSCDASSPNGAITASVTMGGVDADFTFSVFRGQNTTSANEVTRSTATTFTGLSSGIYTVLATHKMTGCFSSKEVTIANMRMNPTVTAVADAAQTVCTAGSEDGAVSANVAGGTAGFTFYWFDGDQTAGTPDVDNPDFTGVTYTGLSEGEYTVVAVNRATSCVSRPAGIMVADETAATTPAIATTLTNQTSCDDTSPNGAITASVTVGGVDADFTFSVFRGQNITPANEVTRSTATTFTGLSSGLYTVLATHNTTGCFNSTEVTIVNMPMDFVVIPVADAAQSICTAGSEDGAVSANVAGGTAGFTFYWFDGDQTAGTPNVDNPDFTGVTYTGLSAGDYTVVAVNTATDCVSDPAVISVADETGITEPTITTMLTDQTSCDDSSPNGAIIASAATASGGVDADFTFRVFRGQNTTLNEVTRSTATTFTGLSSGIYTVLATHNVKGCFNSKEVTIDDGVVFPTISAVPTPISRCDPDNGSITASVDIDDVADYTFMWYNGTSIKPAPDHTETSNILSGLSAGTYTVEAVHNSRSCNTNAVTVVIADPAKILIEELSRTIPADCNAGSGGLEVRASFPGNTSGFTFAWYSGDINIGLTDLMNSGTTAPTNENTIQGLRSGRYTVIVQDNDTGCQDSLVMDLPYNEQHTILEVVTTPNTDCTVFDGTATIQVDPSPATIGLMGGTARQDWYRIDVYQNGVRVETTSGAAPPATSTTITGLSSGDYTVIAVEVHPLLVNSCETSRDFTIMDMSVDPVITLNTSTDNTNCTAAPNGNGTISLTIDGVMTPAAGYTYSWYEGRFAMGTVLPAAQTLLGHTATDLTGGDYTVEVTNTTSNCPTVATFNIMDNPPIISLTTIDTTPDTNCNVDDGTAEVTALSLDTPTDYTYEWLDSDGITLIAGAGTAATIDVLAPLDGGPPGGTGVDYFVRATHRTNFCASSLVKFTITNTATDPVINDTDIVDNTQCDADGVITFFNGAITIEIDGGEPAGDYTINWVDVASGDDLLTAFPTAMMTMNGLMISGVESGNYRVEVTDDTPANAGCMTSATFFVPENPPIISITEIVPTPDSNCSPDNGTAKVTMLSLGDFNDYTYEWFLDSGGTMPIPGAGTATSIAADVSLDGGPSGGTGVDYFVRATHGMNSCASSLVKFTITNTAKNPDINATITDNTQCGAPFDGAITIEIDGGEPVADYTINWVDVASGDDLNIAVPAAMITMDGLMISRVPSGNYRVEVTAINPANANQGCMASATFFVPDTPPIISLTTIATTPDTNCNLDDGTAEVTALSFGVPADYTYEWFQSDGTTLVVGAGNVATIGVPLNGGSPNRTGINYFVIATHRTNLCISSSAKFTITNTAKVALTGIVDLMPVCEGSNFTLEAQSMESLPASATFLWTKPDNTTETTTTPMLQVTNAGTSQAGQYQVEMQVGSCASNSVNTIVQIVPTSSIQITSSDGLSFCTGQSTTLAVPQLETSTYQWSKNGVSIASGGDTYKIDITESGEYTVRITTVESCLIMPTVVTVDVYDEPIANFAVVRPICTGQEVTFTNTSTYRPDIAPTFLWDFGDAQTSAEENPTHIYRTAGNFTVTLTTSYDASCSDTYQQSVTINDANTTVNCDPFLQVGQKVVFVAKTATESTLDVFSTLRWQLNKPNTGAEWITNIAASGGNSDPSSITGENDASITITTTANPNDAGRSTTLTLTAIDMAGNALTDPSPVTISFTQLGTTHTGDVFVRTQAEVDALRTSLTAGATRIMGNVTIGPESGTSDISDLSPFEAITEITGYVLVWNNPDLPNLIGLNHLQSIGGGFEVINNDALTSLGGFPMLANIGSSDGITVPSTGTDEDDVSILIEGNDLLQDCCVLTAFLSGAANAVSGQVFIGDNATGCNSETEIIPCTAQTITFTSTAAGNVGMSITLAATATSTLPVTFAITAQTRTSGTGDVATLAAGVLTLVSSGEVTITAMQAGGNSRGITYALAMEMQIITVSKATQIITFNTPAGDITRTVGDDITLEATTDASELFVTFSIDPATEIATLTDDGTGDGTGSLTLDGAGTVMVTASQAGDATYAPAANVTHTITVEAVLGIEEVTDGFVLYPNPTSGKLHFSEQVGQFRLYSVEGRLLETWKNVRSVDLTARHAGLYFAEVVRDGRSVRYRIMREQSENYELGITIPTKLG